MNFSKGMVNSLLVFTLIGIILLAMSSYLFIQNFKYADTLALENNYYKMQDIKHSIVLASKKGAEEGEIIYKIKYEAWKKCVCVSCLEEPTNCVIPSYYSCPVCGDEPSLETEIKQRIVEHLSSLNNYYENEERYSIRLWCGEATQGQLSDLSWQMKSDKTAKIYSNSIENCHDYFSIYTNADGTITIKFQKQDFYLQNTHKIIGISLYDLYTDISTVAFIPNTEEFDIIWI
ncbi:MAG: hypothetical protein WC356_04030 [Candidatus Micrarchaeia archaeon]|jgi:hypothetical protein